MSSKRTRDRQLAKLAARRQQERRAAKRRRDLVLGGIGVVAAVALVVVGLSILRDSDEGTPSPTTTASPTASAAPTGAPSPTGETVTPAVQPPSEVACGAEAPPAAGEPKPQYDRAPGTDTLDPETAYRAVIETSCGRIVVDLDAGGAPRAVASFVFLAGEGFFDGLTFHRVVPGFVVQAGDPAGDGTGGPGYGFEDELRGRMRYEEGTLAMANSGPNTNGSQWFVVSGPDGANLDQTPNYTIFGEVVDGIDVVARIDGVPVEGDRPTQAVYVEAIAIRERSAPADGGAADGEG
ncbi:MAG TPA: peptidylprolyl isomerase [Actinomycetota bacterium]